MAGRIRSTSDSSKGVYNYVYAGTNYGTYNDTGKIQSSTCIDVTGSPNVDHPLTITTLSSNDFLPLGGVVADGPYMGTGFASPYYGPFDIYATGHLPFDLGDPSADLTRAIARTNPSRPGVTPLTLIQDLVEIPKQLKDVGKLIKNIKHKNLLTAKETANQYLGLKFGWLPLIKDVQDLFSFQQQVHQRIGELNRLYSDTGLHRSIRLGSTGNSSSQKGLVLSSNLGVQAYTDLDRSTKVTRWASVRWKPTTVPKFNPSDKDRIMQARELVSGLTTEGLLNGLWEVIPWTWVIDWFTDVHGFAMTWSNTVPATPYSACVMQHAKTTSTFVTTPIPGSAAVGGNGQWAYETKERFVGGASVNAFLPFIGADRLSIIGSLFVQRFK
jgi:hypothetical protein